MSDKQELQKAVDEYKKAQRETDEQLNKAAEQARQIRQEQTASPNPPG